MRALVTLCCVLCLCVGAAAATTVCSPDPPQSPVDGATLISPLFVQHPNFAVFTFPPLGDDMDLDEMTVETTGYGPPGYTAYDADHFFLLDCDAGLYYWWEFGGGEPFTGFTWTMDISGIGCHCDSTYWLEVGDWTGGDGLVPTVETACITGDCEPPFDVAGALIAIELKLDLLAGIS